MNKLTRNNIHYFPEKGQFHYAVQRHGIVPGRNQLRAEFLIEDFNEAIEKLQNKLTYWQLTGKWLGGAK